MGLNSPGGDPPSAATMKTRASYRVRKRTPARDDATALRRSKRLLAQAVQENKPCSFVQSFGTNATTSSFDSSRQGEYTPPSSSQSDPGAHCVSGSAHKRKRDDDKADRDGETGSPSKKRRPSGLATKAAPSQNFADGSACLLPTPLSSPLKKGRSASDTTGAALLKRRRADSEAELPAERDSFVVGQGEQPAIKKHRLDKGTDSAPKADQGTSDADTTVKKDKLNTDTNFGDAGEVQVLLKESHDQTLEDGDDAAQEDSLAPHKESTPPEALVKEDTKVYSKEDRPAPSEDTSPGGRHTNDKGSDPEKPAPGRLPVNGGTEGASKVDPTAAGGETRPRSPLTGEKQSFGQDLQALDKEPFFERPLPNGGTEVPLEVDRSARSGDSHHDPYGSYVSWEDYFGNWPPTMASPDRSRKRGQSRQCSLRSYSQRRRDGQVPPPWSPKHVLLMATHGIHMVSNDTATISDTCKQSCERLKAADYPLPSGETYQADIVEWSIQRGHEQNERRVWRDVTNILVPSPEMLNKRGQANLPNLCEVMDAEWSAYGPMLSGPTPKPDFAVGLRGSAFTQQELATLRHSAPGVPAEVTMDMYFPFLCCETKGGAGLFDEAERQAMHGISVAGKVLVSLAEKVGAAAELHREIIGFKVAHNNSLIRIFAVFAFLAEGRFNFYPHCIVSLDFYHLSKSEGWAKSHGIIRAIYGDFGRRHLERIKSYICRLPAPPEPSRASPSDPIEQDGSEAGSSAVVYDGVFKRPTLSASEVSRREKEELEDALQKALNDQAKMQQENEDKLRKQRESFEQQIARSHEQLAGIKLQLEEQKSSAEHQLKQMIAEQTDQLKKQFQDALAAMQPR